MSGTPDLELTPNAEFADRLEQTLMAEMGFSAVTASISTSSSVRAAGGHQAARRWMLATAAALVAALALAFVVERSEAPSTRVFVALPTAPTTTPPTTTVTSTSALPPALPRGPLQGGVTYRVPRSAVLGRYVQFTNTVEGATSLAGPGGFVVASDAELFEVLLSVVDLSSVRFFTDLLADAHAIPDDAGLTQATTEPPEDFFAYFAALPGVVAGPLTDAEIAGRPAKAMTWRFDEFEGGFPCGPAPACVNVGWIGVFISSYWAGNSGTTYLVDLDGQQVLVEVRDVPGAQEAADSLVIAD